MIEKNCATGVENAPCGAFLLDRIPRRHYICAIVMTTQRYKSLADYLDQTGTSQTALARELGVRPSFISRIVSRTRQPNLALAVEIANRYGVPLSSLVCTSYASSRPERVQ